MFYLPFYFHQLVDWIMTKAVGEMKRGIQWTFAKRLEYLDFADGIAFLAQLNLPKIKRMRMNSRSSERIQFYGTVIDEADEFPT